MKILLTGTIHVGKTTLLEELKRKGLPNVGFVPEIAREMLTENPQLEKDPHLQDILFDEQVRREEETQRNNSLVVCDRGSLDIIAHSRLFGHTVRKPWEDWLNTYTKIFLLSKLDVSFSGDNRAFSDPGRDWLQFRESLNTHIESVLADYSLAYEFLAGSIDRRIDKVSSVIGNMHQGIEGGRRRNVEQL